MGSTLNNHLCKQYQLANCSLSICTPRPKLSVSLPLNAPIVWTQVIQAGTKRTHALKLIRPRTEPARIMTVIAANTNWKYTIVDMGKVRSGIPDAASGIIAGASSNTAGAAGLGLPRNGNHCSPKAILYAHKSQTRSTAAKAYIAMKAELIAHFFLTIPA